MSIRRSVTLLVAAAAIVVAACSSPTAPKAAKNPRADVITINPGGM
jgi:hypothetical protein